MPGGILLAVVIVGIDALRCQSVWDIPKHGIRCCSFEENRRKSAPSVVIHLPRSSVSGITPSDDIDVHFDVFRTMIDAHSQVKRPVHPVMDFT